MKYSTTHVRHDSAHCLAPGLFRSLKKGDRKNKKLDITYNHGPKTTVRFIGFEPLGADDMRLLQAIVALSGVSNLIIDNDSPSEGKSEKLKNLLNAQIIRDEYSWKSKAVRTTVYSLIKEMGYSSDSNQKRKQIIESITRLSNVTIIYTKENLTWSTNLISFITDEIDGRLYIANNPKITEAILGKSAYTYISMQEVRILRTDSARILHQRLCAVIDPGKKKKINIQTLIEYVWGDDNRKESSSTRVRKMRIKKSLEEIKMTQGWFFNEEANNSYLIERFYLKKTCAASALTETNYRIN